MDKKGFTLVELIAVIALIAIISLLTFPNLNNLRKNNNEKEYQTIEDMMVEYVKVIPNYRSKTKICLSELNINIQEKINNNLICTGYVNVTETKLTPYLSCTQNETLVYQTEGYSSGSGC